MDQEKLSEKAYWEELWQRQNLPAVASLCPDTERTLERFLPRDPGWSFLEVGCAPGKFMAYFHRKYGYAVTGVEYAEAAAEMTRANLASLDVPGTVATMDFFEYARIGRQHDVVFSGGFVEHFADLQDVVSQLCALASKVVVTSVPNLVGLDGLLCKAFRPALYATHRPVDLKELRRAHEGCGLRTLFCSFVDGLRLSAKAPERSSRCRALGRAIRLPVRVFNTVSDKISRITGHWPHLRLLSPAILYIGTR